ncbi:MAG: peptide deformylase [Oligoflexales bacterium]|nr:peptide deformylase [Oligoflexales bacterium]
MAILKIVEWPNKVLETKASEVTVFNEAVQKFVKNMHETMIASNGIGLAANQVNSLQRIITIKIPFAGHRYEKEEKEERLWWHDKDFTFINPVITKKQGKIKYQEGCLSFPQIYDYVDRASEVWVQAKDEKGVDFEVHATGLFAVCLQHEIDHIDGIVFINRMSRLKSSMIKKKILKTTVFDETEEFTHA